MQTVAREAADSGIAFLKDLGEPAPYLLLHSAALSALAASPTLDSAARIPPHEVQAQVQSAFQAAFIQGNGFKRFGASQHSLEVGWWWLEQDPHEILSLSDRVEMELVRYMLKTSSFTMEELDHFACSTFNGLFTTDPELVETCLESYADDDPDNPGFLRLRLQDAPVLRRSDLVEISNILCNSNTPNNAAFARAHLFHW